MGFDYNKTKGHSGQDSMWTSYSDLFLGLSIIFLLLYVASSLRQGTDGLKQSGENKRLVKEVDDLRQQIKVYETLKQDYLNQQASQDEQSTYAELMGKLDLLQENSKEEKIKLQLQAKENEKKEIALNKYQQLIRNIINSNMIAKSRIKNRDTLIGNKQEEISAKTQEIANLEETVARRSSELKASVEKTEVLTANLNEKMKQLKNSYRSHKINKQKYEQQQAQLKQDAERKLAELHTANANAKVKLEQANEDLVRTSARLTESEGKVEKLGSEKSKLQTALNESDVRQKMETDRLRGEFENQKRAERAAFEAKLEKEKLSGNARAAREAQFKAEAEQKAADLASKISSLDKKYRDSQGALAIDLLSSVGIANCAQVRFCFSFV